MSEEKSGARLTRRTFIKTAGTTGVTVYVLLSSPAWVGPRLAVAANLTALDDTQAKDDAGDGPPAVPPRQARR